jgi:hypothetical protein
MSTAVPVRLDNFKPSVELQGVDKCLSPGQGQASRGARTSMHRMGGTFVVYEFERDADTYTATSLSSHELYSRIKKLMSRDDLAGGCGPERIASAMPGEGEGTDAVGRTASAREGRKQRQYLRSGKGLHIRDLRLFDPGSSCQPVILVRRNAIVLKLGSGLSRGRGGKAELQRQDSGKNNGDAVDLQLRAVMPNDCAAAPMPLQALGAMALSARDWTMHDR